MSRPGVAATVGGALLALLLVAVATSGEVRYFERSPSFSLESLRAELFGTEFADLEIDVGEEESDVFLIWEASLPPVISVVLEILLVAVGVFVVVEAWKRRPRLRWRPVRRFEDFEVVDDLAAMVTADAAAQRRALAQGSPRNAIVACWLRLEAVSESAGFEPSPADTAEEASARLRSFFGLDGEPVERLASLYREARFSSHVMGEDRRIEAVEALDAIHRALDSDRAALR